MVKGFGEVQEYGCLSFSPQARSAMLRLSGVSHDLR